MRRLLLLPVLVLLMAGRSVPLELPLPITLPEPVDTIRISKAVLTAFANKKWLVEADTGESITARFDSRDRALRIRVDYTPKTLTFHYVDSGGLSYEKFEGADFIHPKANKWLLQVEKEIHIQLARFRFEREPAEVVPVEEK
jgi:hypothetical protein